VTLNGSPVEFKVIENNVLEVSVSVDLNKAFQLKFIF